MDTVFLRQESRQETTKAGRKESQRGEPQPNADRQRLDASVKSARPEAFGAFAVPVAVSLTSRWFRWL
jgi:hypothetical protein